MRDDLKKFKVDFEATDTNGSGTLSIGEVKAVLKAAGYTGSSNLMFFNLDKNKDFRVSRDEFQNVVGDSPKATEEEMALRREFQRIDSNKGGTLSQAELMGTLHGTGSSIIPRETTEKILEYTVTDSDGEVSYDEFLRLVGFDDSESELRKIFSAIDKDLRGDLSREDRAPSTDFQGHLFSGSGLPRQRGRLSSVCDHLDGQKSYGGDCGHITTRVDGIFLCQHIK